MEFRTWDELVERGSAIAGALRYSDDDPRALPGRRAAEFEQLIQVDNLEPQYLTIAMESQMLRSFGALAIFPYWQAEILWGNGLNEARALVSIGTGTQVTIYGSALRVRARATEGYDGRDLTGPGLAGTVLAQVSPGPAPSASFSPRARMLAKASDAVGTVSNGPLVLIPPYARDVTIIGQAAGATPLDALPDVEIRHLSPNGGLLAVTSASLTPSRIIPNATHVQLANQNAETAIVRSWFDFGINL